ncbi:MAG TPA: hypothetical protein VNU97_11795 [Rhizomicrobium sp.]|jgi:hypothetical protein|nr:hypothetical protein [Rhizomicrobium sp.]
MKKIICAVLALTLLGSTAAEARGWGHGGWRGDGGAVLGIGLGLLALGAIASESDHDRYYRDRERARERDEYYRERHDDQGGAYDRGDDGYRDGDRDARHDRDDGDE